MKVPSVQNGNTVSKTTTVIPEVAAGILGMVHAGRLGELVEVVGKDFGLQIIAD